MRLILGFALAFAIGAVCRLARIPSPAPNALLGSLLVVAMSVFCWRIAVGRWKLPQRVAVVRRGHTQARSDCLGTHFGRTAVGLRFRHLPAADGLKDYASRARPAGV